MYHSLLWHIPYIPVNIHVDQHVILTLIWLHLRVKITYSFLQCSVSVVGNNEIEEMSYIS